MLDLRELVVCWQRGWTVARGLPAAEDVGAGLRVRCMQSGRDIEYFAFGPGPGPVRDLAGRVAAERDVAWLTVPTADPAATAAVLEAAGLVLLKRAEQLMTIDLRTHPRRAPAAGYRVETSLTGAVLTTTVLHESGETGAQGTMGLTGPDGIADKIATVPAHQRRGLGSTLMGALAEAAVAQGAGRGLLIASEEGRHLYSRLGWRPAADVLIATTPGNALPS